VTIGNGALIGEAPAAAPAEAPSLAALASLIVQIAMRVDVLAQVVVAQNANVEALTAKVSELEAKPDAAKAAFQSSLDALEGSKS